MQNRVFNATDVLIHRQPVVHVFVGHAIGAIGARKVRVVPRRIHEGIHGVGFALRGPAAFGTGAIHEIGALVQRVTRTIGHAIFGQHHRQIFVRHRHITTRVAMNQRNRCAPITLARDAPIAQAIQHLLFAQPLGGQIGGYRVHGGAISQVIVFIGVFANAVLLVGIPFLPCIGAEGFAFDIDHGFDRQVVLPGKMKITFVMRRHGHHRAFAITHQHIVTDPHFNFFAGQRMLDEDAGGHALLVHGRHIGFHHRAAFAFVDKGGELGVALRRACSERMLCGYSDEGHPHDGVSAGGEHP